MKMRYLLLSTILSLTMFGCGGGSGDSGEGGVQAPLKVAVAGLPSDEEAKVSLCLDENADYRCDDNARSPDEFVLDKTLDEGALTLVQLSAPEEIGASRFEQFGGERVFAIPAPEASVSPIDLLAYGVLLMAQQEGDACCAGYPKPTNMKESKELLSKLYNLDGSNKQNAAILEAYNHNLELLGGQGLELSEAVPANIKAMAEVLVNLTVQAQGICELRPEYCETPQEQYPPVNLSALAPQAECVRYEGIICVEWVGVAALNGFDGNPGDLTEISNNSLLLINKDDAVSIAGAIREKSDKLKPYEQAIAKQMTCEDNETQNIYMFGMADNFDDTNTEPATPDANLLAALQSVGWNIASYDVESSVRNPSIFGETMSGLPSNVTQAAFVISLKERGYSLSDIYVTYFDQFFIGTNIFASSNEKVQMPVSDIRTTWTTAGADTYIRDMSQIVQDDGQSLLAKMQSGQSSLDVAAYVTTNVNFIAVATCEPKPVITGTPFTKIVTTVTEKFECNEDAGEEFVQVIGGVVDDFATPTDTVMPQFSTSGWSIPTVEYDETFEKVGVLADSLALPSGNITRAQLIVNTRPVFPNPDDRIFAGDVTNNWFVSAPPIGPHSFSDTFATQNGGTARLFYDNFPAVSYGSSSTTPNGDLLSILNSGITHFDLDIFRQTEVDAAVLQLCVTDKCRDTDGDGYCDDEEIEQGSDPFNPASTPNDIDGDGTPNDEDCDPLDPEISVGCDTGTTTTVLPESCDDRLQVDLRQAASWNYNGGNPVENNVFANHPTYGGIVWDGAMNWFDFGSAGNTQHDLSIDFCSCGGGDVVVEELKSDNFSKVYLDADATPNSFSSGDYIASRSNGISQSTMASWGPSVSGSESIPYSGNGVNHKLHLKVKNGFGPSGAAIDGYIDIKGGHLGECTDEDVLPSEPAIDNGPTETSTVLDDIDSGFICNTSQYRSVYTKGTVDLMSAVSPDDASNPSSTSLAGIAPWTQFPVVGYDELIDDRFFADTFYNLTGSISQAKLVIGYETLGGSNDTLAIGKYAASSSATNGIRSYNVRNLASNGWDVASVTSNQSIASIDLSTVTGSTFSGDMLGVIRANDFLDVVVQDDTSVDFVRLYTCTSLQIPEPPRPPLVFEETVAVNAVLDFDVQADVEEAEVVALVNDVQP